MADWIAWFIALITTCIQWLGSMQLMGISVMWIIIAGFFLALMVRALMFKP